MKIIDFRKLKNRFEFSPICLSMGFFDGVHIGHQKLISDVCFYSKKIGGFSAVLTHYNHPKTILDPSHVPFLLMSFEEKMNIISSLGVDFAFVSKFDKEFASITAEKFVSDILVDKLNVKYVCIGKNRSWNPPKERLKSHFTRELYHIAGAIASFAPENPKNRQQSV